MIAQLRSRMKIFRTHGARGATITAVVILVGVGTMAGAFAQTESDEPPTFAPGELNSFDGAGVAGLVDFQFLYPDVLVFRVQGGVLESSSQASGTGNAKGVAGPMPVPLAYQAGEVFPSNDPVTGSEIPGEAKQGWQSINWQGLPNQCKSEYPDIYGQGNDKRHCGGPAQDDAALGFTAAMLNGRSLATGDTEDPLKTKVVSTSRGLDVTIPAIQATIHQAWAETTSGVNEDGVPETRSVVEMDGVAVLGGLIKFTGLKSIALAETDGTEEGTKTSTSFSLGAASVAGFPVNIGRDGVTIRQEALVPGQSVQDAAKSVSDALDAADVKVRLAPAPSAKKVGSESAVSSMGVEVIHQGESVRRTDSYYRFGYVSAAMSALRSSASDFGDLGESEGGESEDDVSFTSQGSDSTTSDASSTYGGSDFSYTGTSDFSSSGGDFSGGTSVAASPSYNSEASTGFSPESYASDPSVTTDFGGSTDTSPEAFAPATGGTDMSSGAVAPEVTLNATYAASPLSSADLKNLSSALLGLAFVCAAALPLRWIVRR